MKIIKTYELFTESIRNKMVGKSDEDVRKFLSILDIEDRLKKIKEMELDSSYLPPREEIEEFLKDLTTEEILDKNKTLGLPIEYLPPREEIEKYLPSDISDRLRKIKEYKLDKSFLPPREEINKLLRSRSISIWKWGVKNYGLDDSYLPSKEYIKSVLKEKYDNDEELKEKAEALLQFLKDEGNTDDDMTIYDLEPTGDYYGMEEFTNLAGGTWESYSVGTDEEADKAAHEKVDSLIDEIGYGGFNNGFADSYIDGDRFADDYYTDEEDYIRGNFREYGIATEDELNYSAKREIDELEEEIERLENERNILDSSDEGADELDKEIEDLEQEIQDIKDDEDNYDVDEDALEAYCDEQKTDIANDPIDYLKNMGYDQDAIDSAIERYIDRDKFIEGIIEAHGRGQSMASYDGEEYEVKYNDTWYYIYRTN